jgi:hypothetical protein
MTLRRYFTTSVIAHLEPHDFTIQVHSKIRPLLYALILSQIHRSANTGAKQGVPSSTAYRGGRLFTHKVKNEKIVKKDTKLSLCLLIDCHFIIIVEKSAKKETKINTISLKLGCFIHLDIAINRCYHQPLALLLLQQMS